MRGARKTPITKGDSMWSAQVHPAPAASLQPASLAAQTAASAPASAPSSAAAPSSPYPAQHRKYPAAHGVGFRWIPSGAVSHIAGAGFNPPPARGPLLTACVYSGVFVVIDLRFAQIVVGPAVQRLRARRQAAAAAPPAEQPHQHHPPTAGRSARRGARRSRGRTRHTIRIASAPVRAHGPAPGQISCQGSYAHPLISSISACSWSISWSDSFLRVLNAARNCGAATRQRFPPQTARCGPRRIHPGSSGRLQCPFRSAAARPRTAA